MPVGIGKGIVNIPVLFYNLLFYVGQYFFTRVKPGSSSDTPKKEHDTTPKKISCKNHIFIMFVHRNL